MTVTPAGWYPDGQGGTRWWDGASWTDQVQPTPGQTDGSAPEPSGRSSLPRLLLIGGLVLVGAIVVVALVLVARRPPEIAADCASLAENAAALSTPGGQPRLQQLLDATVVEDNTANYQRPTGAEPTLVLSCRGTGTYADGTQAPTVLRLSYGSGGTYFVSYAAA